MNRESPADQYIVNAFGSTQGIYCIRYKNKGFIENTSTGTVVGFDCHASSTLDKSKYCEVTGLVYYTAGNVLYSVDLDGKKNTIFWKRGGKADKLSILGLWENHMLVKVDYHSFKQGYYDGELCIVDVNDGFCQSVKEKSILNCQTYPITMSDKGIEYLVCKDGTSYYLISIDMNSGEYADLGKFDVEENAPWLSEWSGFIENNQLIFISDNGYTDYIIVDNLAGEVTFDYKSRSDIAMDCLSKFSVRDIGHLTLIDGKAFTLVHGSSKYSFQYSLCELDWQNQKMTLLEEYSEGLVIEKFFSYDGKIYAYGPDEILIKKH